MLGVYLEVYSVFGYEPKQTEWGPRSRGPQTATGPSIVTGNTGRSVLSDAATAVGVVVVDWIVATVVAAGIN